MAKIIPFPVPSDWFKDGAVALGLTSAALGLISVLAPRWFVRAVGLPIAREAAGDVVVRSVGARDAIIGLGIWSAATHGGNLAPWLLARGVADAADAASIALAWQRGARNPRLLGLGALALAAVVVDATLYLEARRRRGRVERAGQASAQVNA